MKNVNYHELSKIIKFNTKDIVLPNVLVAVYGMKYNQSELENFINSRSVKSVESYNIRLIDDYSELHEYRVTLNDNRALYLKIVVNYKATADSYIMSENNENFEYAYSQDDNGNLIVNQYRVDLTINYSDSIYISHVLEADMIIDYFRGLDYVHDLLNKNCRVLNSLLKDMEIFFMNEANIFGHPLSADSADNPI